MSFGFGYGSPWSLTGLIHALAEIAILIVRLWWQYLQLGGVVVVIFIHLEWRVILAIKCSSWA